VHLLRDIETGAANLVDILLHGIKNVLAVLGVILTIECDCGSEIEGGSLAWNLLFGAPIFTTIRIETKILTIVKRLFDSIWAVSNPFLDIQFDVIV
jgi:hypothetical protein